MSRPSAGQFLLVAIAQVEQDEVVALVGQAKLAAQALEGLGRFDEVGNDEDDRAAALDVVDEVERGGDVGAAALRNVEKNFADDAQHVLAALGGRDVVLDLVGEEKQADLVAIADGGEGEDAGDFGGQFAFALGVASRIFPRR